jgi:hypothetical protein
VQDISSKNMVASFPFLDICCEEVLYFLPSFLVVLLDNGINQLECKTCSIHGLYILEADSATYSRFVRTSSNCLQSEVDVENSRNYHASCSLILLNTSRYLVLLTSRWTKVSVSLLRQSKFLWSPEALTHSQECLLGTAH